MRFCNGSVFRFLNAVSVCIGAVSVLNRVKNLVQFFLCFLVRFFKGVRTENHVHISLYCAVFFNTFIFSSKQNYIIKNCKSLKIQLVTTLTN